MRYKTALRYDRITFSWKYLHTTYHKNCLQDESEVRIAARECDSG